MHSAVCLRMSVSGAGVGELPPLYTRNEVRINCFPFGRVYMHLLASGEILITARSCVWFTCAASNVLSWSSVRAQYSN